MTSHQFRAKLEAALALIADTEHMLETRDELSRLFAEDDLKARVAGFMDAHRQALQDGGEP